MPWRVSTRALLVAAAVCALAETARAQSAACPPGNLLAGKRPDRWFDIRGDVALVTNNEVAPEGALWNASPAVILGPGAAALTYALGAVTTVNAIYVQADNNDTYRVWGSLDGRDWRPVAIIDRVDIGQGLRARRVGTGGAQARYLRFGDG